MSLTQEERFRRIAEGVCTICGVNRAEEGLRCCAECLAHARDVYREREDRKRKLRAMAREKAAMDREIEHQREECERCELKKYVGDRRWTCPSAHGTCLRMDIRAEQRAQLQAQIQREADELELLDEAAEEAEKDEICANV